MSGHSKWSTIKRQKGANDAKRGALFTKVAREIAVAARLGGGDPDGNYRLRLAIEKARQVNMPQDNIKRTIEKATGGGDADQFEEIVYEGYGPGGVAVLVEAQTDNRNRTAAEVRSMFTKAGGQLAGSGAVAWQFEPRGLITITRNGIDADEVALAAIDAGAEDVDTDDAETVEIYTAPNDLERVRSTLEDSGIPVESAESAMIAKQIRRSRSACSLSTPPSMSCSRSTRHDCSPSSDCSFRGTRRRRSRSGRRAASSCSPQPSIASRSSRRRRTRSSRRSPGMARRTRSRSNGWSSSSSGWPNCLGPTTPPTPSPSPSGAPTVPARAAGDSRR